jgi:hypothetical protein
MYGDCSLVESKDLADHIIKISRMMESVIDAHVNNTIDNWEMTRDILVVLGEIMTRCMIKLYDNHMSVFVARDDMDDTMAPGYLYTEAFVMEADEQPRVEVDTGDNNNAGKIKTAMKTFKDNAINLYHRFLSWVQTNLSQGPFRFMKDHEKEIAFVKDNKVNAEITKAINARTFSPMITNFPDLNIPAQKINSEGKNIDAIVTDLLSKPEMPTNIADVIKKLINSEEKPKKYNLDKNVFKHISFAKIINDEIIFLVHSKNICEIRLVDDKFTLIEKFVHNGEEVYAVDLFYEENGLNIITLDIKGNVNLYKNKNEVTLFNLYELNTIDKDYKDKQFFSMGYAYYIKSNLNFFCISSDHGCFIIKKNDIDNNHNNN